jgi:uncharacterized protein (TIRG00374 family)
LSNRPKIKRWVSLLAIVGFVIFVVYLFFFTDLTKVGLIISGVNVPVYALVFLLVIGEAAFNSLAWKATLDNVSVKTTFKRVFYLGWVGAFLDCLIVGGWSGDIFMTYLLGSDEGVDIVKVAASVIVKDILELLVTLLALILGLILLILNYSIDTFVLVAIGVTMSFFALPLILIVYLSTNISVTKKLVQFLVQIIAKIKHKKPDVEFGEKIAVQITNFHDVIMIIKRKPKSMVKPLIFQTMTWICSIVALYLVFVSLGAFIGFDKIIITNTIVSTISNQGIALTGFSQIVSSGLYQVLGIDISMAQASSLLGGFASFWFVFVLSFGFFELYGLGTVAEKLLNKAFKEKNKRDKEDFKNQTNSNQRDFNEKTDNDKKKFKKQIGIDENDYNQQKDSDKKDFDEKTDEEKSKWLEERDIHRKDFKEKTESDKKDFEELSNNNKNEYEEKRGSDKKVFEEKINSERKDFEKLREDNENDYNQKKYIAKKDFGDKTGRNKSKRMTQKSNHRKDFKEKTDSDKKAFKVMRDKNESDYIEQKVNDQVDFKERTASDNNEFKEQKDNDKKIFEDKMEKAKKDFIAKKAAKNEK